MTSTKSRLQQSQNWQEIWVEQDVIAYPWVQDFLAKHHHIPHRIIPFIGHAIAAQHEFPYPSDPYGFSRLLLGKQQGHFIRPCPCSPNTVRCGYYFISVGLGCPIDCTYCFLQGFLNSPFPVLYVNFPDLILELDAWEKELAQENRYVRVGTGEMTDSLVFEPCCGYAKLLASQFHRWPHLILELKTKTTFVDNLIDCAVPNIVLGWSVNPDIVASVEEQHAPGLMERLMAAQKAVQAGYRVGFHFDPIVGIPEWEKHYYSTLQTLFHLIPANQVAWISLGIFRIFPSLRDTIRAQHPQTQLLSHESVIGYDGKLRYFRPQRVQIYKNMAKWIQELGSPEVPTYLCMESQEVWQDVFGDSTLRFRVPGFPRELWLGNDPRSQPKCPCCTS